MNANVQAVVEACSRGSEKDWLNFGQVLEKLAGVGVEGYYADFRRSAKTYYLPDGKNIEVKANDPDVAIASAFDAGHVEAAVRQSQAGTHTYRAFCEKVMAAGCAGCCDAVSCTLAARLKRMSSTSPTNRGLRILVAGR